MVVRFGRIVEPGFLPVFSVDTEEDARLLLASTCKLNYHGEYVADELIETQSLDNLYAFGDRLKRTWEQLNKGEVS